MSSLSLHIILLVLQIRMWSIYKFLAKEFERWLIVLMTIEAVYFFQIVRCATFQTIKLQ